MMPRRTVTRIRRKPPPADEVLGEHSAHTAGVSSEGDDGSRAPLPFDEVDEMVTQFLQSHRMLWMTGPENKEFYSPTRMPAFAYQISADAEG